jgi:predicted amidohydrolase
MQDLRVTLIQADLYWQNPTANRAMLEEKIWEIEGQTDLIILPEMFTTGFTMEAAKHAEVMNITTMKWMKQQAAQTGAVVTGSYIVKENGQFFNRLLWIEPDGSFETYDKRHLFRMANEDESYTMGEERLICEWKGWRICPMICYDLRFPVWSRNQYLTSEKRMDYDLLLYVANWPAARVSAWDTLLQARAAENLSYVIGVNRMGQDGKGIDYNGHSVVVDPKGLQEKQLVDDAVVYTQTLSGDVLMAYREKFPAYLDADSYIDTQSSD